MERKSDDFERGEVKVHDETLAWIVPPKKLPEFLKMVRQFSSGDSSGRKWAENIMVKNIGDDFIVTADTIHYPYCEYELEKFLNGTPRP